jgi:L-asparagine transporter-like permease
MPISPREALGADPMYRAWKDSGAQPKKLPWRIERWVMGLMLLFVLFTLGLLVTGVTGANWYICGPIMVVAIVVACYAYYRDWKDHQK